MAYSQTETRPVTPQPPLDMTILFMGDQTQRLAEIGRAAHFSPLEAAGSLRSYLTDRRWEPEHTVPLQRIMQVFEASLGNYSPLGVYRKKPEGSPFTPKQEEATMALVAGILSKVPLVSQLQREITITHFETSATEVANLRPLIVSGVRRVLVGQDIDTQTAKGLLNLVGNHGSWQEVVEAADGYLERTDEKPELATILTAFKNAFTRERKGVHALIPLKETEQDIIKGLLARIKSKVSSADGLTRDIVNAQLALLEKIPHLRQLVPA